MGGRCGRRDYERFWVENGQNVLELYEKLGNIGLVAEAVGKGRGSVTRYIKRNGKVRPVADVLRDSWTSEKRVAFGLKVSSYWSGRKRECPWMYGERNPNWNGGSTQLCKNIRNSRRYDRWRRRVYTRDGYKCVRCGSGGRLNANHIIAFSAIVRENKITSMADAAKCAALWDITNGETLCLSCHKKTVNYAGRAHRKKVVHV